ncbi:hypothetical protein PSPO01_03332 [Paraphaeosphaeria sporulosa]
MNVLTKAPTSHDLAHPVPGGGFEHYE